MNTVEVDSMNCLCGEMDAKKYHGKKRIHVALGIVFGPYAMIGTALVSPNPYTGEQTASLSDNKELFSDPTYLNCYKKKARHQLLGMEGIGFGLDIILAALLFSYLNGWKR